MTLYETIRWVSISNYGHQPFKFQLNHEPFCIVPLNMALRIVISGKRQ